jgi:hypothetical protein
VVQDDQPITSSENGPFVKEDMNTNNCALLITIVIILCILVYRIGNGGNKLIVFVFVFVPAVPVAKFAASVVDTSGEPSLANISANFRKIFQ